MTTEIRADLTDAEFVASMPKVELHVHIEGTIEPEMLFAIADRNGIELPYDTPEGVLAYQASKKAEGRENLVNFLECLDTSRGALGTAEDYHAVTVDFLRRCREEGVRYVEMMFDPQQAIRQGVPFGDCVDALVQGRNDGRRDHGVSSQWIMCFQRDHDPAEALPLMRAAEPYGDDIVGIGLDNYETPGFPALFAPVYELAREQGYRLTSHCDVNQPDSLAHIRACIDDLGVERIDHGLNAIDEPSLLELVLERGVALTGCPTFYAGQESSPDWRLEMHRTLLAAGALISLNTDDPAQFGSGWLTNTMLGAMLSAPFSRSEIVGFARNAVDSAWLDDAGRAAHRAELATFCSG
ncbi:MAG: adenosine deaminase [Actinomycetia bacterium]|nr:adenosine deaminase [Actinomycetes bacterium]